MAGVILPRRIKDARKQSNPGVQGILGGHRWNEQRSDLRSAGGYRAKESVVTTLRLSELRPILVGLYRLAASVSAIGTPPQQIY